MKETPLILLAGVAGLLCGCASHPRARTPAPAPPTSVPAASQPVFSVTEMRVQTFHSAPFFYYATRTTLADISQAARKALSALHVETQQGHVIVSGPPLFIYHGVTEDLNKPFDLEIGVPVPPDTRASGPFKVRLLGGFHCATLVYNGPMSMLGKGYDSLINQMLSAHLSPGDESREMYLYWEGPDSPNDVLQLQVQIR